MNKKYLATKIIGDACASQIKGQNEDITTWLVHKLKHSFCVAHDIMDIFFNEKQLWDTFSSQEKELVELSGILHDLGRFYQHKDGKILPNTEFNHGKYATDLLKSNENFNNPILLFAIEEHNLIAIQYDSPYYTNLSEHDKNIADNIAKLLRDADKLENIKNFIYNGVAFPKKETDNTGLSPEVKTALATEKHISNKITKTACDKVANFLSWVNDIYFPFTKSKIKELGFVEKGLNIAKLYGATEEDCDLIKKHLQD